MKITQLRAALRKLADNPASDYYLLGLLIVALAVANVAWISLESRPPHWDMGRHLLYSLKYQTDLETGNIPYLIGAYRYYPPFLYWATQPFYLLFGAGITAAVLSVQAWMALLAVSTYNLGKRLWNRQAGLLAAFFALTSPMVVSQFKEYQLDAPLAAWTALSLYLLVRSEDFKDHRFTRLFGLAFGFGMLLKWTFPLLFLLPIAWALARGIAKARAEGTALAHCKQLGIALGITAIIAGPWYAANLHFLKPDLAMNATASGIREGDPAVGTTASNTWYLLNLFNNQLRLLPAAVFLAGALITFRKKAFVAKNLYPLLLAAGTLAIFTLLRNKDARYTLPAISGISIVATFWISLLATRWKALATGAVVAYGTLAFVAISFGISWLPLEITSGTEPRLTHFAQYGYIIGAPSGEDWHQEEIVRAIAEIEPGDSARVQVIARETIWFNSWGFNYYNRLHGVTEATSIEEANFVIQRIGAEETELPPSGFVQLKSWQLPDGGTASLFRRTAQ